MSNPTIEEMFPLPTSTVNANRQAVARNVARSSHTSGDDIESALEIIDANDGLGQWEEPDVPAGTPRWLFPRFAGAEKIGTCSTHEGAHTLVDSGKKADQCEDFTPDAGNMYLSRTGLGPYDTDVETVAAYLAAPRNIVGGVMLIGEPGTGKSALAQAACTHAGRTLTMVTATQDDTRDSLFLRFVGEGNGENGTPFALGQIPLAVRDGHTLVVDEYWLWPDGIKAGVSYNLLDGSHWLPGANVDGSAMEVHPDFRMIVTANPQVRGASLPEPIGSRFASTTITVETGAPLLRDMALDEAIVAAWEHLGNAGLWRPQIREMRLADYWLSIDPAQAVSAFLPEHCPESQRRAVRDAVVSFLGGSSVRTDGRLVVS